MNPAEHWDKVKAAIIALMTEVRQYFRSHIVPALAENGIHVLNYDGLIPKEREEANAQFMESILPLLMLLAYDPFRPFPHITNLGLHIAVLIRDQKHNERFAHIRVPDAISGFVQVHRGLQQGFIWVAQVIAANLAFVFPGMEVLEAHPFRLMREAELAVDDFEEGEFLEFVEEQVRQRHFAPIVALVVGDQMSEKLQEILRENLDVAAENVYRAARRVYLSPIAELAHRSARSALPAACSSHGRCSFTSEKEPGHIRCDSRT